MTTKAKTNSTIKAIIPFALVVAFAFDDVDIGGVGAVGAVGYVGVGGVGYVGVGAVGYVGVGGVGAGAGAGADTKLPQNERK